MTDRKHHGRHVDCHKGRLTRPDSCPCSTRTRCGQNVPKLKEQRYLLYKVHVPCTRAAATLHKRQSRDWDRSTALGQRRYAHFETSAFVCPQAFASLLPSFAISLLLLEWSRELVSTSRATTFEIHDRSTLHQIATQLVARRSSRDSLIISASSYPQVYHGMLSDWLDAGSNMR